MQTGTGGKTPARPPVDTALPKPWDARLAYLISQVGSPPVLSAAVMALLASTLSAPGVWAWAGIHVALAILAPTVYLFRMVRRGQITDLDVQLREQRPKPLLFTIGSAGLAELLLVLGGAPSEMVVVTGLLWLQMVALYGITLRWKISFHSAAAAGVAALVWALAGALLPVLGGVLAVSWSRVRLRRHTVPQTVAGAVLGLAFVFPALPML